MVPPVVVVLLVALGAAWLGVRASGVRGDLTAAAVKLRQLERDLDAGDIPAARRTLAALQRETRSAAAGVEDVMWRLADGLPGPGRDLAAVRTMAAALDELATRAIPPLVDAAARLGPGAFAPGPGGVDVEGVRAVAPGMATAHQTLKRIVARVGSVPTGGLSKRVSAPLAELRRHLDRAVRLAEVAWRASTLLPAMLGADGPRTYLVLFQNPAEVRATGGMPGAFAVVTATAGQVRLVEQGTASIGLRRFDAPVVPVDPDARSLYSDEIAWHPASINMSPHFPAAAVVAREMYRLRSGRVVDGVLAVDPVALAYLLRATGPVQVPGGDPLTAGNAVQTLLSGVYARYRTQEEQDDYFARAARATFDTLVRAPGDGRALLAQLSRAAGERRILVWSARPEEQRVIAGTVLEGALPSGDHDRPTIGVFLNDGGASKLGYYLTQAAELGEGCRTDGRREVTLRVTLGSTAPVSGLPKAVLSVAVVPNPYTVRTFVSVHAPVGWGIVGTELDGKSVPVTGGRERGRFVALLTIDVPAGGSRVLDTRLVEANRHTGTATHRAPQLFTTPMVVPWHTKRTLTAGCGK